MGVQICSDGTLKCRTVMFNYKQAKNLVYNGDFEYDLDGWTTSQGWQIQSGSNAYCFNSSKSISINAGAVTSPYDAAITQPMYGGGCTSIM